MAAGGRWNAVPKEARLKMFKKAKTMLGRVSHLKASRHIPIHCHFFLESVEFLKREPGSKILKF